MDIQSVNNSIGLNNVFLSQKPLNNPVYNMSNLGKVLHKKLKDQAHKKQAYEPSKTTENLEAVTNKIKRLHLVSEQAEKVQQINEQSKREFQSELYYKKFTLENQQTYVLQHNEFVVHELIRSSFKPLRGEEKKLKKFMKQKMFGYKCELPKYENNNILSENVAKENRKKYFQFIANKVNNNQVIELGDEINLIKERKFWQILDQQIKCYQKAIENNSLNPEIAITKASINMLSASFSQILPHNEEEINNFMIAKYMNSKNIDKYRKNDMDLYQWALAFAYFRAGKINQLYSTLTRMGNSGVQLRQAFSNFLQGLNSLNPAPESLVEGNIPDLFYQQLIYFLKGEVKFLDRKFFEPCSQDLIWAVLYFYKIFISQSPERQRDYKIMLQKIKQSLIENSKAIKNPHEHFLYLSAYPELIQYFEVNQNQQNFNEDDFIHLLLILKDKSEILSKSQRRTIEDTLKQRLQMYIKNLIVNHPQAAPYYISLLSPHHLQQSLNNIIGTYSEFMKVQEQKIQSESSWNYVMQKYEQRGLQDIFIKAFSSLVEKLIKKQSGNKKQFDLLKICARIFGSERKYSENMILHGFFSHLKKLQDFERNNQWQETPNHPHQYISEYKSLVSQFGSNEFKQTISFLVTYSQFFKILNYTSKKQKIKCLKTLLDEQRYLKEINGLENLFYQLNHQQAAFLIFNYVCMVQTANQMVNTARGNYSKIIQFKKITKQLIKTAGECLGKEPGYAQLLKMYDS